MSRIHILLLLLLLIPNCAPHRLDGRPPAEDLWGSQIRLDSHTRGLTLVLPFSPSNCGYCLFDGEFVERNYLERNVRAGGTNFYQCLFSPQLDVYSYTKHYRDEQTAVITFPPAYHDLHRDGFPMILAINRGHQTAAEYLSPYEESFRTLRRRFWPDQDSAIALTSPYHMATRFVYENKNHLAIVVVPDGDTQKRLEIAGPDGAGLGEAASVKFESDLSESDLELNLCYRGPASAFRFHGLTGLDAPIRMDGAVVAIGPYRFPKSAIGMRACYPNPHNRERYLVLELLETGAKAPPGTNATDFAIWKSEEGQVEYLLRGFFRKDGAHQPADPRAAGARPDSQGGSLHEVDAGQARNRWSFDESLAIRSPELDAFCAGGFCPAPVSAPGHESSTTPVLPTVRVGRSTELGQVWTLGGSACRFPSLCVDTDGTCWCAWEEHGDIYLSGIGDSQDPTATTIETDGSDSFSPVVATSGSAVWVFYLNNHDGFYRLYGRRLKGSDLSEPVLVSDLTPFDAITPAAASRPDGRVAIAWSEWRANQRFLQYRELVGGSLTDTKEVAIKMPENGYVNAWWPSLTHDASGRLWGAWNQHYPSTLGVCSGDLLEEASSVVRLVGSIEQNENGGYPSIAVDGTDRRMVVCESFGWELVSGKAQQIRASYFEPASGQWCVPLDISGNAGTHYNQTPRASADRDGGVMIAWSGRKRDSGAWGIYLTRLVGDRWSRPLRVSEESVSARAPAIATGPEGAVWIAWHEGVGEEMKVRLLKHVPNAIEAS